MIGESTRILVPGRVTVTEQTHAQQTRLPGIGELWRASMHTLGAHSAPILACALLGLVGAQLLGALANALMTFDVYFRSSGVYIANTSTFFVQLLIQAGLGTFAAALARGAISWMALQHANGQSVPLSAALSRSAARWPVLLVGTLVYGTLATLGIAGLTLFLRELRLDLTNVGRVVIDIDGITRVLSIRMVNGFVPDPGSPFSEIVSYARYALRRSGANNYWLFTYRQNLDDVSLRLWLIAISSLAPLIAGSTLMRLRAAAIMSAAQPNQLAALYEGMRLGVQHFGYIFRHGLLLWLASSALNALFVAAPQVLSQFLLVPALARSTNNLWPYPVSTLLFALAASLVSMVLMAFAAVYDAHLYRSLTRD